MILMIFYVHCPLANGHLYLGKTRLYNVLSYDGFALLTKRSTPPVGCNLIEQKKIILPTNYPLMINFTLDVSSSCNKSIRSKCRCSCCATNVFFFELKDILTLMIPCLVSLFFLSKLYHIVIPAAGIV